MHISLKWFSLLQKELNIPLQLNIALLGFENINNNPFVTDPKELSTLLQQTLSSYQPFCWKTCICTIFHFVVDLTDWLYYFIVCVFFDSWEITSEIHNNLECRTNSTYQWLGAFDWQICWKSKFRLLQIKNNNLQMKHQKLKWYFMFFLDHTLRWR